MTVTHPDVLLGVTDIVREICGDAVADKVEPDATFAEDLHIDSLSMVEVVVACEERFSVKIPDQELENLVRVQDALDFIARAAG